MDPDHIADIIVESSQPKKYLNVEQVVINILWVRIFV